MDLLTSHTQDIVEYLASLTKFSKSHMNPVRSGLASVYNVIHQGKTKLADDMFIQEFFKSMNRTKIKLPNKYQEVWDPTIVLNFIRQNWTSNKHIPLYILQKKAIMLICLGSMWRTRSDVGELQYRDIKFIMPKDSSKPIGVILLARAPKEGPQKESKLGCIEEESIITNAVFNHQSSQNLTKKSTTSEVESQSTEIETSMPLNQTL